MRSLAKILLVVVLFVAGVLLVLLALRALEPEQAAQQASAVAASTAQAAGETPEPAAPEELVRNYGRRPTMADLEQYSQEDIEELLRLFEEVEALEQKRGIVWALALHGDQRAVQAFEKELKTIDPQQVLTRPEEDALLDMVLTMGFLADEEPAALELLKQGTQPGYWEDVRQWESERGEFSTDMLVEFSLQGLGISGRPEAQRLLSDELKTRDPNYLHRFAGGITQAAFYSDLRAKQGEKGLCSYMLAPGDKQAFMDWISAGEGKTLFEWANSVMSGPEPSPAS